MSEYSISSEAAGGNDTNRSFQAFVAMLERCSPGITSGIEWVQSGVAFEVSALSSTTSMRAVVEWITSADYALAQKIARYINAHRISFCITTCTAYHHFIAQQMCDRLHLEMPDLDKALLMDVMTVVHEAVMNALIHGNMDIHQSLSSYDALLELQQHTESRLQDPLYAERYLWVGLNWNAHSIHVVIADEGRGFDLDKVREKSRRSLSGTEIIEQLTTRIVRKKRGAEIELIFERRSQLTQKIQPEIIKHSPEKSLPIILADDQEFSLMILHKILTNAGYTEIHSARNGKEALQKIEQLNPALLITDIVMPEMDGISLCNTLRGMHNFHHLPILVQTAMESPQERMNIFAAGATDIILKPVFAEELVVRVQMHLERQKLLSELSDYQKRVQQDMSLARSMQQSLLPDKHTLLDLEASRHISVTTYTELAEEIGGDLWGVVPLNDKETFLYSVDVSGHGIAAALNAFRLHTLLHQSSALMSDPSALLRHMNRLLHGMLEVGQFATMWAGVIHRKNHTLQYASAGAPLPLYGSSSQQALSFLEAKGLPLGCVADAEYEAHHAAFLPQDFLLLYSDALIETKDASGAFIAEEALMDFCRPMLSDPHMAKQAFHHMKENFLSYRKVYLRDDLTLNLVMRVA